MSERQKNKLLAVYLIMVNAGLSVSAGMLEKIRQIEKERAAAIVARV